MANSWNGPKLGSPIRTDVPELQKKLIALLKQDPTSVANIPSGAKRLVNTSGTKWQVQQYNGSSWAAIGKLMHDVDKLDGYHAAITPNANTIAVRNADKKLEGDITGNAATASTATTLSETLPVNKGGTGATTSAQARTNLGVPPTSHASSGTTYGLGSNANYGHVRGDGVTTNVVSGEVVAKDIALGGDSADPATGRGFFYDTYAPEYNGESAFITDFDQLTIPGNYHIRFSNTTLNAPDGVIYNNSGNNDGYIEIFKISSASTISSYSRIGQRLTVFGINGFATERVQGVSSTGAFNPWRRLIDNENVATASTPGIVKPGTGMTVNAEGALNVDTASTSKAGIVKLNNTVKSTSTAQAATANAVKAAYDKASAAAFPAGTQMLFVQAAAPTGWTKQTTVNDATIRIVSGNTGGKTGGSVAFSTAFVESKAITLSGNVGATTLSTGQMPSHTHGINTKYQNSASDKGINADLSSNRTSAGAKTVATGGSSSHTHSLSGTATVNLSVKYVDVILCKKD